MDTAAKIGAIYEAFGKGDIPFILGQLAPDVEWEAWPDWTPHKAGVSWLQPRRGPEGALEFFKIIGSWSITDFQVRAIMTSGDQGVAQISIAVTLPDGGSFADEEMHLWQFNNEGKVAFFRHYVDTAKHIAAAKAAPVATAR